MRRAAFACLLWALATSFVAVAQQLQVTVVNPPLMVDSAGNLTLVLLLRNTAAEERWIHVVGELPSGWQLATSLRDLHVPAGQQRAFPVVVYGRASAAAGSIAGTFEFRDIAGVLLATLTWQAQVPPRPQLELRLHDAPLVVVDALPNLTAVVRNLGNVAERVRIEASAGVVVQPAEVFLEAGASRELRVSGAGVPRVGASQRLEIELRARGDAGGQAAVRHTLNLLTSEVVNRGRWHTLPATLSLSARTGTGAAAAQSGVRLSLTGGGVWREGFPAKVRFALHVDPNGTPPHGTIAWEAPRFGVRFGFGALSGAAGAASGEGLAMQVWTQWGRAGQLEVAWQNSAGVSDLRAVVRWQDLRAERLRTSLLLDAGVRSTAASEPVWRGRALLGVRYDHLALTVDANHAPAPAEGPPAERSEVRARVDLNLLGLLALEGGALERLALRGGVGAARTVAVGGEEHLLDASLQLNLGLALHERLRVASELGWERTETTDPVTGWRQVERALHLNLNAAADLGLGLFNPTVGVELAPDRLALRAEWGFPVGSEAGRFSVQPQLLWRAANPFRADLTLRSSNWMIGGFNLAGLMRFGIDAAGARDWEGGAVLHGRLTYAGLDGIDVRAALKLLDGGWRAEVAAGGELDLSGAARLAWEAKSVFASATPMSLQVGVRYDYQFGMPTGRRRDVGDVTGTLRRHDGSPLAGVGVRVAGQTVATSATGEFRFPNLDAGAYTLSFTAGTLGAGMLLTPPGPTRVVVAAGETTRLELVVVPAAAVAGEVVIAPPDSPGDAPPLLVGSGDSARDARGLAGVSVVLSRAGVSRRAVSDARGLFRFSDLEPGSYTLEVEAPGLPSGLRIAPHPTTLEITAGAYLTLVIPLEPVVRTVTVVEGGVLTPR
jgi:hypothetical protein